MNLWPRHRTVISGHEAPAAPAAGSGQVLLFKGTPCGIKQHLVVNWLLLAAQIEGILWSRV